MKRHRTFVAAIGAAVLVTLIALGTTSAVLGEKNRQLIAANRTAEENFEQAHATLRNVIEFALHGRTLSDNVVLDPVRLEILQRALGYLEQLRSNQANNRDLILEHALVLTSLGTVESRLGKTSDAIQHDRAALDLFGEPREGESLDWRHGRALAKLRLADALDSRNGKRASESESLLRSAGAELFLLAKENRAGAAVLEFNDLADPAMLLSQVLEEMPKLTGEQPDWLTLSDERLSAALLGNAEREILAQSQRGYVWYFVAIRATHGTVGAEAALRASEKARAAFERCVALVSARTSGNKKGIEFRWELAQIHAIHAVCLSEKKERRPEAVAEMRQACAEQRRLLPEMESRGEDLVAAWKEIDPTLAKIPSAKVNRRETVPWQFSLAKNLTLLADIVWNKGDDAKADYAEAERALAALEPVTDWPAPIRLRIAQCQVRLAAYVSQRGSSEKAIRIADSARQTLERLRIPGANDSELDIPLYQSYLILGDLALPKSASQAIPWLEKTQEMQQSVGKPSDGVFGQVLSANAKVLLAIAWAKTDPMPYEKIWRVSHEALAILDALRHQDKEFAKGELIHQAMQHLSGSAIVWTNALAHSSLQPWEKIWHVAQDTLHALEAFDDIEMDSTDRRQLRSLTTDLVAAALGWAMEVQNRAPVSKAEIAKICDPAIAALQRLKDRAGPLSVKEAEHLEMLETFRDAKYDKP